MTNAEVKSIVGNLPHMTIKQAEIITKFIEDHDIHSILELGFRHGVSTCYMAASLSRSGGGSIVTIDLEGARKAAPNIEELLGRIGERERVDVYYEPTSYIWRLMRMLEQDPNPRFDFCYLDGAHSWFVDGFAFFLVDRLLKPGGWIIFDDLNWTYHTSPTNKDLDHVKKMPIDEQTTPQVRLVYDLLVKSHPDYYHFKVINDWGFAQKKELNRRTPSIWFNLTEKLKRRT